MNIKQEIYKQMRTLRTEEDLQDIANKFSSYNLTGEEYKVLMDTLTAISIGSGIIPFNLKLHAAKEEVLSDEVINSYYT